MRTSLQEDLAAGAPSELDALGGALLRVGEPHGIPTPAVSSIVTGARLERVKIARFSHDGDTIDPTASSTRTPSWCSRATRCSPDSTPPGERVPLGKVGVAARAGHPALEGGRRRQELPRARRRDGRRSAGRAAAVPQAEHRGDRARATRSSLPPQSQQVDYEGELAVVIGKIAKNVPAEDAARPRLRLHRRQRRDRTRPAEDRRPVDAGQRLRHLLPARPGDRDRARPAGRVPAHPRQRRAEAGRRDHATWCTTSRRSSRTPRASSRCCPAT